MGRHTDQGKHCEWAERIRRRRESGLTVAEFCEWEGVSVASFYNWQKKLQGTNSRRPTAGLVTPESRSQRSMQNASFLPVRVTQAGATVAPSTRIEIQLTNGVRIFVPISDSQTVESTVSIASCLSALNDTAINQIRPLAEDATC